MPATLSEVSLPAGKVHTRKELPKMGPLFLKAALNGRGPKGKAAPTDSYKLVDHRIDADHLARYQHVCGFPGTDALPATYLHVLAFPLQFTLLTEPSFPFAAAGTVHINNTITQLRPVTLDEVVSITVHSENLRPHSAGRQIDFVSQGYVGDELVWLDRSTYLSRGKPAGEKPAGEKKERPADELPAGVAAIIAVPGDTGRRYAAVAGDNNPIHLSGLSAKAFGFKAAIAHGMWLKARTLATLDGRLPQAYTVDVAFKTPVFLPSKVAVRSELIGSVWNVDVRNPRSGKPHLAATVG